MVAGAQCGKMFWKADIEVSVRSGVETENMGTSWVGVNII
jgi:hypothetical protein